jgi:hypothetical protein
LSAAATASENRKAKRNIWQGVCEMNQQVKDLNQLVNDWMGIAIRDKLDRKKVISTLENVSNYLHEISPILAESLCDCDLSSSAQFEQTEYLTDEVDELIKDLELCKQSLI